MLKVLENVRAGIEKTSAVSNTYLNKRVTNFDISEFKTISVEDNYTVSIQHIQGDNYEGRFLLSGKSDGTLLLHKIKNTSPHLQYKCKRIWKCTRSNKDGHKYSVECVRWYPRDNGLFVTGGFDKTIKIWDTSNLICVETISCEGEVYNFDLSPCLTRNCTVAVCSSKGTVSILELHSGTSIHTLKHHQGVVLTCNWSPFEENILATGGTDNKVLLWDVRSAKSCLRSLNRCNTKLINSDDRNVFTAHAGSVNSVKFVKNGLKLVSCGTDNIIRLWDTLTGKNELVNYDNFTNGSKRSIQIDISKNTTPEIMYVPCVDFINLYEVNSGKFLKTLGGHFSKVNCCYYEPFQHELYSSCSNGVVVIWCDEENQLLSLG